MIVEILVVPFLFLQQLSTEENEEHDEKDTVLISLNVWRHKTSNSKRLQLVIVIYFGYCNIK